MKIWNLLTCTAFLAATSVSAAEISEAEIHRFFSDAEKAFFTRDAEAVINTLDKGFTLQGCFTVKQTSSTPLAGMKNCTDENYQQYVTGIREQFNGPTPFTKTTYEIEVIDIKYKNGYAIVQTKTTDRFIAGEMKMGCDDTAESHLVKTGGKVLIQKHRSNALCF